MVIAKVKKQTGDIAKRVARQMAAEPLEILKKAPEQIAGVERAPEAAPAVPEAGNVPTTAEKAKIEAQGQRQLKALEAEIRDIQVQQQQKQTARAQEAQTQISQESAPKKPLKEPPAKPSRRLLGFGRKTQAERQKTRIEKPLPPSG